MSMPDESTVSQSEIDSSAVEETTRHAWPAVARCDNQIRLLRVDPPLGGAYDAFEVRRTRIRSWRDLPPSVTHALPRRTSLQSQPAERRTLRDRCRRAAPSRCA